jgi:hypothetical protein
MGKYVGPHQERGRKEEVVMCPACISTATIIVGATVSGGGLTALAVSLRGKLWGKKNIPNTNQNEQPKQKS